MGDVEDGGVVELVSAGEGAVGLELYLLAFAEAEQLLLVEERVELDLVGLAVTALRKHDTIMLFVGDYASSFQDR